MTRLRQGYGGLGRSPAEPEPLADPARQLAGAGYWYLASPYSRYRGGLDEAHRLAARAAAALMLRGVCSYSPIAHCHALALHGGIDPRDTGLWLGAQRAMMEAARGLVVLALDGWRESEGLQIEIEWFCSVGRPVWLLPPDLAALPSARPAPAAQAPA